MNKSLTYLLPLLGGSWKDYEGNVENMYCGFKDMPDGDKMLILQLKIKDTSSVEFKKYLVNHKYFKWTDTLNEKLLYVFEPDLYGKAIVETFIQGRYSRLPFDYKKEIVKFFKLTPADKIYKILYLDNILRQELEKDLGVAIDVNQELSSIPNLEYELLDVSL